VVVALWLGYALGYHRGARGERLAWESTLQVDLYPYTTANGAVSMAVSALRTNAWPIRDRFLYTNPHGAVLFSYSPGAAVVNRPDPRTYRQFEHPQPFTPVEQRPGTEFGPEF